MKNTMNFKQFIQIVDNRIESATGLSLLDLPDVDFYNYYDKDLTKEELIDMADECASDMLRDYNNSIY